MASQDDDFGLTDDAINGKTPPSQKVIDWLHGRVSTQKATDIHHRLGTADTDASPGNHTHDGKNSYPLFSENDILTDISNTATGTQIATAVNKINALLRQLGAGGA